MTHDVLNEVAIGLDEGPLGFNIHFHEVDIDITSLDAQGVETSFSAADHLPTGAAIIGVEVVGQQDPQYLVTYGKPDDELHVNSATDAGQINAGTPVGEVDMLVIGRDARD